MFSFNLKLNFPWFKEKEKSCLGVDIGTSAVKIIELSKKEDKIILKNYAEVKSNILFKSMYHQQQFGKTNLAFPPQGVSKILTLTLEKAKIKTKKVIFSLADFSSFFTVIELPYMTREEIPSAIYFAAKQYVPIPLQEVVLDWTILSSIPQEKKRLKILLVVIPKNVVDRYKKIAKNSRLQLLGLEAEIFALIKSIEKILDEKPVILLDIGARSTTISIIENRRLKISYSFQFSGFELINIIVKKLAIEPRQAEKLITESGLNDAKLKDTVLPFLEKLISKINLVSKDFEQKENKKISKIFISGGTSSLNGLKEYLSDSLKREVNLINPFYDFSYPGSLDPVLKKMAPSFGIAVGSALQAIEYNLKN